MLAELNRCIPGVGADLLPLSAQLLHSITEVALSNLNIELSGNISLRRSIEVGPRRSTVKAAAAAQILLPAVCTCLGHKSSVIATRTLFDCMHYMVLSLSC